MTDKRHSYSRMYKLWLKQISKAWTLAYSPPFLLTAGSSGDRIADPFLEEINRETGETIHLALLFDDRVVYVDKRESSHSIRMYSVVGKSAPVHCTGVGKAVMAFQDEAQMDLDRLLEFRSTLVGKCDMISINVGWKHNG